MLFFFFVVSDQVDVPGHVKVYVAPVPRTATEADVTHLFYKLFYHSFQFLLYICINAYILSKGYNHCASVSINRSFWYRTMLEKHTYEFNFRSWLFLLLFMILFIFILLYLWSILCFMHDCNLKLNKCHSFLCITKHQSKK